MWLSSYRLDRNQVFDYFALSPFYDRTCNKEPAENGGYSSFGHALSLVRDFLSSSFLRQFEFEFMTLEVMFAISAFRNS